jgi:nucleotide-binding universal stress UspA family protein
MNVQPSVTHPESSTDGEQRFRKILVGFDGSEGSRRALAQALRLAAADGASIHVLSVIEHLPRYAATVSEVEETREAEERHVALLQAEVQSAAESRGLAVESAVRTGHPAKAMVEYAQHGGFDLLVLGHAGHSALWGQFLGTTSDKVIRHAPCSVLVVR